MNTPSRLAIFPGSFDPFTVGHADVAARAARLFDRVIVAILVNPDKRPMFDVDERVAMIRESMAETTPVEVETFQGLLADFAARRGAAAIVRGLRSGTDFDYELQMAGMNRHLQAGTETVFLTPAEGTSYISSGLVREIITHGGPVDGLVPEPVRRRVLERRNSAGTRRA